MTTERAKAKSPRSLSGLVPFLRPYRGRIALAGFFLVMAAASTLVFPLALRSLIDGGLVSSDTTAAGKGQQLLLLRNHFFELFGVAAALGLFSAGRFYMVSWLGERVTADLRNAVYGHVLKQSPQFFETTQTGEVLSRLTGAKRREPAKQGSLYNKPEVDNSFAASCQSLREQQMVLSCRIKAKTASCKKCR